MSLSRALIASSSWASLKRSTGIWFPSRCSLSSTSILANQFHSRVDMRSFPQAAERWRNPVRGESVQHFASIHSSSVTNRSETRIDDSLNRLDVEIRRVGRIRRQEVDDILEDIKEMKKATSSQSLMIIRCCGELIPEESPIQRTELVQQVWQTLESLKVPMDVSHYNALLRVYIENEHKFNPTEFLQDLTSKGIEPNRVTYQRLIARFCQDGDIDGASTILQHMKDKQLPINEYVFNALIMGHGQANDMESAEGILNVMRQAGLQPNDDTYVTLMSCYAKQGDIANIHRIAKECGDKEIFLIDRDFFNVIHELAENGHVQLIDEVLPYLKKHIGFNQEATNIIFRLVNIGQEEAAYKILKQMTPLIRPGQDEPVPSGNFFVKHLVQLSKPSDVIVKYCRALQDDGLNKCALSRACEFALGSRKFDLAVELFEALQQSGIPIRQHYFWPFFANASSEKDVLFGLKCMRDLGFTPTTETLREYIVPNILNNKNDTTEKTLHRLSSATGVPMGTVVSAAVLHLLQQGEMGLAAEFSSTYKFPFGNQQVRRALVDAYLKTNNAEALVKMISCSTEEDVESAREHVGMVLIDLVESLRGSARREAVLLPLLKLLLSNGLGLSNSGSELLQNCLGEALTPEIANAIIQLTSSELTPKLTLVKATARDANRRGPQMMEEKSTEELEQLLADAGKRNAPTKGIKKALLYSYCRDKNIEKVQKLKEELTKEDFVFSPGLYAMFLEAYVASEKVEDAKKAYEELKSQPDFVIDDLKILRYAALLQTSGDTEGCIEVLRNAPRDESRKPSGAGQQAIVWKILNSVAESGSSTPESVKQMFDLLIERKLTPVSNVTLGPLVKAYILKDDLAGALQEFERCVKEYRVTPWKQELFCRFIKIEDADRLQKVMDLSTAIHGEVNSMYDLVFAFIDCGKIRQARKILETPGLRARNDKIETFCQKYCQENRVAELENLLQVTKDLIDTDRNTMYFYLLQAYCKQGDPDKALSVWTSMQEENVQPSVELLIYLADFLQKSNLPVPFIVPEASEIPSGTTSSTEPVKPAGLPRSISEFRKCVDLNDVDKALQIKQRLESEGSSFSVSDSSQLIELLTRAERLNEATRVSEQLFDQGLHPFPRTLRFLLGRLGSAGDVNAIERMNDKLNIEIKRRVMYNSRLCAAYTNSGRGAEFYENYIKKTIESGTETTEALNVTADEQEFGNIPVFAASALLMKNEHLLQDYEELASKAGETYKKALYNGLWSYYMSKREFGRAEEIMTAHLKQEPRILFRALGMEARTSNDAELAQNLGSQILAAEKVESRAKATASSFALDILGKAGRIDDALEHLKEALKTIKVEDYPPATLFRLKEQVESAKKTFPYDIPKRRSATRGNVSSDSDSD